MALLIIPFYPPNVPRFRRPLLETSKPDSKLLTSPSQSKLHCLTGLFQIGSANLPLARYGRHSKSQLSSP